MSRVAAIRTGFARIGLPAVAILFMGFFGFNAVLGPNGVLAYREYDKQLTARQGELDCLNERHAALRNRVTLLDPKHADPDMVDELVRRKLALTHPDEIIVPLDGVEVAAKPCIHARG